MTKNDFHKLFCNRFVFLDGATGSNLVKAGMPAGVCPEAWCMEHQDVLMDLQMRYLEAGSDIIYAPTFTANRIKLSEYHLEDRMEEIITTLVGLSKSVVASSKKKKAYVAADLTMTGQQLKPMGTMELESLIDVYKEQIILSEKAGADLIVVETMLSLAEVRAALIAAKEVSSLPVMVTFSFEKNGRTLFGSDPETVAVVCESLGADAIGVNCSTGPADMAPIISAMASVSTIPIIAKPNAGLPGLDEQGHTVYSMDAATFVEEMDLLTEAGASILGGCCGTDPTFIAGIYQKYADKVPATVERRPQGIRYLSSERKTVAFGLDDPFMIVGERINPTGKKKLQAQLREGQMDLVLQFASEQEQMGAKLLDINMGMSGIDEKEMMLRTLDEVQGVTNLPLSLDSSYVDVLEAALRHYPGRALVNSVSLETEKYEKLLPIVAKYGAMFILLPLSDAGLPKNVEEKISIIDKIYHRAIELGMRKEDIVVDGLVQTVGANPSAGLETLETISYCKKNGFATICGLSNISFGMPERSYVNTAFLVMAIQNGLTMAIANPSQDLLVCCALASDLLLARPDSSLAYIDKSSAVAESNKEKEAKAKEQLTIEIRSEMAGKFGGVLPLENSDKNEKNGTKEQTDDSVNSMSDVQMTVFQAVMKGNRSGIVQITRDAVEAGEDPSILLNDVLIPAINEVGDLFNKGKYFLPQLMGSAEAMKLSIEVLEPLLINEGEDGSQKPGIVIATVEGDIHDIGKNLVAMMLKNYGFRVTDLGKDVPASQIIDTAIEESADIICLSALMTTTMQRMKEVIALAKERSCKAKIMIGGAVITQEYADEIGADGYSQDAAEAVVVAKRLLHID